MIGSGYDYESDKDCVEDNQDVVYKRLFYEGYHQQIFSEDEDEVDSKACNMLSTSEDVNLRMPSQEEISKITADMIAQVQSNYNLRNITTNDKPEKTAGIFIKDTMPKVQKVLKEQEPLVVKIKDQKGKKWEAKKELIVKKVERKEKSSPTESTMLECKDTNPNL